MLGEYGVLLGEATGQTGGSGGFDVSRLLAWAQSLPSDNVVMMIAGVSVALLLLMLVFKR